MVFQLHRFLQFLLDILLVLWLFRSLPEKRRRFVSPHLSLLVFLLLAFLYFYNNQTGIDISFVVRFVFRAGIYFLYLLIGKDLHLQTAAFYSVTAATVITCCQNIFFSPLLFPISRGIYAFTPYSLTNELLCFLIQAAVFVLVFYLVSLGLPLQASHLPSRMEWLILALLLLCEMYVKQALKLVNFAEEAISLQFTWFSILLNLVILALLVFFERYVYTTHRWHEIQLQEVQNRYYIKNLELRQEGVANVANLHHDMKNHLLALRTIAKNEDSKRIDAYINRLLEQTVPYEETVETGKPLLDGLISEKVAIAQKNQIGTDIRLDFSEIDFIDDMALCTIFGNALDNAIEACEKVPEEDGRLIQVKSELDAGQLLLYFINSCSGPVSTIDGLPETTKADRQNHGIGLKNIHRALNRYNGTMYVKSTDNRFELILMIPC